MNKKILFAVATLFSINKFQAQEHSFKIEGTIKQYQDVDKILLSYAKNGNLGLDSSKVVNGKFHFEGKTNDEDKAYLQIIGKHLADQKPKSYLEYRILYLDAGTIHVDIDKSLSFAQIYGTPTNDLINNLSKDLAPYTKKQHELADKYASVKSKEEHDQIREEIRKNEVGRSKIIDKFIKDNNTSPLALMELKSQVSPKEEPQRAIDLFDQLSPKLKESYEGKLFNKSLTEDRKFAKGVSFPDLQLPDVNGKEYAIHDFKGKYVLVDFWASWCGPCRKENPNLIQAYKQYKSKGFDIVSISLDGGDDNAAQGKENWIKAIQQDQLTWTQLSDLKGMESTTAKELDIETIPMNFLLDPNGKIVARNLRGNELKEMLEKLF